MTSQTQTTYHSNNNNGHFHGALFRTKAKAQCAVQKDAEKSVNTCNAQNNKVLGLTTVTPHKNSHTAISGNKPKSSVTKSTHNGSDPGRICANFESRFSNQPDHKSTENRMYLCECINCCFISVDKTCESSSLLVPTGLSLDACLVDPT